MKEMAKGWPLRPVVGPWGDPVLWEKVVLRFEEMVMVPKWEKPSAALAFWMRSLVPTRSRA